MSHGPLASKYRGDVGGCGGCQYSDPICTTSILLPAANVESTVLALTTRWVFALSPQCSREKCLHSHLVRSRGVMWGIWFFSRIFFDRPISSQRFCNMYMHNMPCIVTSILQYTSIIMVKSLLKFR